MVYGEQLNTFDESRKDLLEFQNVAMEAIGLLARISNEPPLYKYFPTKTYRRFVGALTYVHEYGTFVVILVMCFSTGPQMRFSCYMYISFFACQ